MVQTNLSGSSKVMILEAPRLAPGTCVVCGTSRTDDRKYIDFGIFVEYVGQIYFCTFCMTELANQLGCLTPEQTIQLENERDAAHQRILEFQIRERALNESINTLRATGLFDRPVDSVGITIPVMEIQSGELPSPQDIVNDNRETEQSDPEQGSDDVPTTTSDEFTDFGL